MIPDIFNPNSYFFNTHSILYFVSGILITAESFFIFSQNRKSLLNFSFAITTLSAGIWLTGIGFMYCSVSEAVAFLWCRYYCWLGIVFITSGVYMLSVMWESGRVGKKAKYVYLNFAIPFIFYLFSIFSTHFIQGVWAYPWGFYPKAGPLEAPFLAWFFILMTLSFRNFIRSYKKEKIPMRKTQTKLIIMAFVFGFAGSVDFLGNYGIPSYAFGAIFAALFSTIIAYTIVNYKLMEIETVIHKTIGWFLTSAALVAPLVTLFYLTKGWWVKLEPVGTWAYLGSVLLAFLFFVKTFQPRVDRFFQRGRVYLESVLNKFSDELIHLRGLEDLINKITDTITESIAASKVTILLHNNRLKKLVNVGRDKVSMKLDIEIDPENPFIKWILENDRVLNRKFIEIDPTYEPVRAEAKEYFEKLGVIICIPLVLNKRLIGLINLGPKANYKSFSALDHHFLTRLKSQATIAISNSLVYDKVEELVKIRTEELVQTQQQLIQAEKLATVGTLAGGVAHEINNPLAAILTNAQMLKLSELESEDKESVDLIEEATKRCRDIVQKLMIYSRKPLGTREIAEVDLKKALDNVIAFLGYQLAQENMKIIMEFKNPPFVFKGCQNELEQVLTNLIINARDATRLVRKGGDIKISVSKSKGQITVKVQDKGPGIPEGSIQKIFDPFFTTKQVGKGTGLGLSICQSIIEQHEGTIRAEPQQGEGAAFIITLPAIK